jgi:YidC/Oxa1 family membrane protein insertase
MNFLGMDLSLSAAQAMGKGFLIALPYLALLGIMLATGLYQNRQLQARNTSGNVNPQQQMIMKFMPFFLPIFSYGFPAGLALYWCTQNFCRIGTNAYITRSVYRKEHEGDAAIEASASEKVTAKKSKGLASGATKNGNGSSSNGDAKAAKPSTPGKSVKSQAAHKKTSGQSSAEGTASSSAKKAPVNARRSGEKRRGPQTSKDK